MMTDNQNWRLLHIDDDEEDYLLTRGRLNLFPGRKITVEWAAGYAEGMERLGAQVYDAVLVDYDLGNRTGIELIRQFAGQDYPTPLILMTGRGSYAVDMEAMHAGATLYLVKAEVTPLLLERSIRYAIERKQSEALLRQARDEARRKEEALRESEARQRRLVDSNIVGVVRGDKTGRLLEVNQYYLDLLGYTRQEFEAGRLDWKAITPPEHLPSDLRAIQEMEQFGVCSPYEKEYLRKDGRRVWVLLSDALLPNGEILAVVVDITKRKLTEEWLRQSEAQLQARAQELEAMLEATPAYVWITRDPKAQVMTGNRMAVTLVRMQPGDNLSATGPEVKRLRAFKARRNGVELAPEQLPMQQVAATGTPIRDYELELAFEDGQVLHLLGNVAPLLDERGRPDGAMSAFIDVTPLKTYQARLQESEQALAQHARELERSNQALREFALIASHDLRDPLRKILLFSNSLRMYLGAGPGALPNTGSGETASGYLDELQQAAEHMQSMIDGLLGLARANTGGGAMQAVDLAEVVREVVSDLEARLRETGGRVIIGELPAVQGDALQMRQLLQNLIGNALKYHHPDRPPIVEVAGRRLPGGRVQVQVDDNGMGFEPEEAQRIFRPFQHLAGGGYEGTGIGLAICKKIVERHGGEITARSQPGQGSRFTVLLPEAGRGLG